ITPAVSSSKHLMKGSKKGAKKKAADQFSKKDWYDVKVPAMFNIRDIGKILVTRTQGTKITSDGLKGRVFEASPADLQNDEAAFRKFKLITEDEQTNDLKKVVNKLIPDSTGKDTEKVHDVFVRKVKMLKKPKFELGKLTELQGEGSSPGKAIGDETGAKVE
uniref:40S ribosomal protein S3a n=1 Tax=Phocoena sinus TaxID=42100 RepID=A0A8C9CPU6_PHOSS